MSNNATISARCWGETHILRADWASAASPIEIQTEDGWEQWAGQQVAAYRHSPQVAMRAYLASVARDSGDNPADTCITQDIEQAVSASMAFAD